MGRNEELSRKAHRYIPAGCHTYSKGRDQFPSNAPPVLVRGQGCWTWDAEGNRFLDWGMGLRSVILGHCHPEVLEAVRRQLERGSNFTRVSDMEVEAAELLCRVIPSAEMVKFCKNGSDVTTGAVKLARSYTGRDLVACPQEHPFFSFDDWFIGTTPCDNGNPGPYKELTLAYPFNDLAALEALFARHPGRIACVITEACSFDPPRPGYLQRVRELCRREGAVFVLDEMITGFRWHLQGAQAFYGVEPDLCTFGKGIANGFSVAALCGRKDIMELGGLDHDRPRTFLLSATHGGEAHALAAAVAAIGVVERERVPDHLWRIGRLLVEGFLALAREAGLEGRAVFLGERCSPAMAFRDAEGRTDWALRTLFLQEMVKAGILMPYVAISHAHGEAEVERTLEASQKALQVCRRAVEQGSVEGLLVGPATKPVFRRLN